MGDIFTPALNFQKSKLELLRRQSEAWKREHLEADACRALEDLIREVNRSAEDLSRLDNDLQLAYAKGADYAPPVEELHDTLFRLWHVVAVVFLRAADGFADRGHEVDGLRELRKNGRDRGGPRPVRCDRWVDGGHPGQGGSRGRRGQDGRRAGCRAVTPPTPNNRRSASFRHLFDDLPEDVRKVAEAKFQLFLTDPDHPSLRRHELRPTATGSHHQPSFSVSINKRYRAVYFISGDRNVWYWVGTHADYDRLACRA